MKRVLKFLRKHENALFIGVFTLMVWAGIILFLLFAAWVDTLIF